MESKTNLINKHLYLLNKYTDDYKSEGFIALVEAAKTFDASKNNDFEGYAQFYITNRIGDFVRREMLYQRKNKYTKQRSLDRDTIYKTTGIRQPNPDRKLIHIDSISHNLFKKPPNIDDVVEIRLSPQEKYIYDMVLNQETFDVIGEKIGLHEFDVTQMVSRIYHKLSNKRRWIIDPRINKKTGGPLSYYDKLMDFFFSDKFDTIPERNKQIVLYALRGFQLKKIGKMFGITTTSVANMCKKYARSV